MLSEDLKKWFKEEWVRIDTQGNITGPCGTMKSKSSPSRCLPKKKAQSLTKAERAATVKKKKEGGKKGKQFVSNTEKAKVTKEEIKPDVLKSFDIKDTLLPEIFDENNEIKKDAKAALIKIAKYFLKFLDMDLKVEDLILTGSSANYNWSNYSDIDLHVLIDFENETSDVSTLKKYFDSKKNTWNKDYDIKFKDYDVELYVQDIDEQHTSTGVYSLMKDEWIVEPKKEDVSIDYKKVYDKANEYSKLVDDLISSSEPDEAKLVSIEKIKDKLKKYRKLGLEKGGEKSIENIVFKALRRNKDIERLADLKKDLIVKTTSVTETKKPKRDRCYYKAVQAYGNKTSAYRSAAMVACRQGKIWKKD
jgi:predicted nucleotidyltransferase